MARFDRHDLAMEVDQERAHIRLSGDIRYHPVRGGGATADCSGARSFTLSAKDVEPRHYTLSYAGEALGQVDLLDPATPPPCLGTRRSKLRMQLPTVREESFSDWAFDPQGGWRNWRGATITALLEPLLGTAPESLEGQPEIAITMKKQLWQAARQRSGNNRPQPFMAVSITRYGLGDDSASADRFFVAVVKRPDGWAVDRLWQQQMCARGPHAGQWTNAACP